ncbi:extracellular solute-binding protein [Streptomyces sp. NPDC050145]|uniref:extracellular solute-binding protein n=1 Tax=Streptomyces sp. NPDC050145 TaxID=3365602 RepID=UPI003792D3AA
MSAIGIRIGAAVRALRALSTRRLLQRHLWLFLACAITGVTLLTAVAVPVLDARARQMSEETAPSAQGAAAVRLAVLRADQDARRSVEQHIAGTVGMGESAESQLAAADQGLTRFADHAGGGVAQNVTAVNGMLVNYGNTITAATVTYRDDAQMRTEKLAAARALLARPDTGILARLEQIARDEQHRSRRLAEPSFPLVTAWAGAVLALVAAAALAFSAARVVRRRCGRVLAPAMLAGGAGAALLAGLSASLAVHTALALAATRDDLAATLRVALAAGLHDDTGVLGSAQKTVAGAGPPALSGSGWWNVAYIVLGVAVVCATVAGLLVRLVQDYPRRRPVDWTRARRLGRAATRTRGRRRGLALAAVLTVVAPVAVPLALPSDPVVTVLGTWTGQEAQRFRTLMADHGINVDYEGTPAQREVLLARVQAGDPPDIAIMPGIGELAGYGDDKVLKPLDEALEGIDPQQDYAGPWNPAAGRGADKGATYWWPVNANLKSIVWHTPKQQGPATALSSWCLGLGEDGATGWPGTDWIEDLVLQRAGPGPYTRWARGAGSWTDEHGPVRAAWRQWAAFLATDQKRAEKALTTDWRGPGALKKDGKAFREEEPRCAYEHQGSFARGDDGATIEDSARLLPGGPYPRRGYEVSGDFAALFDDREPAQRALRVLFSQEVQEDWADEGTMYSAMTPVMKKIGGREGEDGTARAVYRRFRQNDVPRCLDASGVMRPMLRDAFHEAALKTVAAVATDGALSEAELDGILKGLESVQSADTPTGDGESVNRELVVCSGGL